MPSNTDENNDNKTGLDALITLEEAAEISGFTSRHLRKLASQGDIWARKLGHNWFTTKQAVLEYLARDRRPGPKSRNKPD